MFLYNYIFLKDGFYSHQDAILSLRLNLQTYIYLKSSLMGRSRLMYADPLLNFFSTIKRLI